MTQFKFRPGFNPAALNWGGPDEPQSNICSYCGAAIPEDAAPLRMWQAGRAVVFYLWGDVPALMPSTFNGAEHGVKHHGSAAIWFDTGPAALPSSSPRRKAASAMIAKIPLPLSRHIAAVFRP